MNGEVGQGKYRFDEFGAYFRLHAVRSVALFIGISILSGVDLIELFPYFESTVHSPYFEILHDSHDMLAILLVMYATYSWHPALGWYSLGAFAAMHVPYVILTIGSRTPEHVRLVVTIGIAYIAIQLISALLRQYRTEMFTARTLQESLLEVPEKVEGVEIAYFYQSATEATTVGGDFYDVFELDSSRIGILLGDISGKGLSAATSVSRIRDSVRAYSESGDSPGNVMRQVNDLACKTFPEGLFATAFFCVLDTSTGSLEYCNAGHPSGLLAFRGGTVAALEHNSPIVGIFSDLDFRDDSVVLGNDVTLVLYTDGVTESRRNKELFGDERLERLLSELTSTTTVNELPMAIFDHIIEFSEGHVADDVAIIALSLKGDSQL